MRQHKFLNIQGHAFILFYLNVSNTHYNVTMMVSDTIIVKKQQAAAAGKVFLHCYFTKQKIKMLSLEKE